MRPILITFCMLGLALSLTGFVVYYGRYKSIADTALNTQAQICNLEQVQERVLLRVDSAKISPKVVYRVVERIKYVRVEAPPVEVQFDDTSSVSLPAVQTSYNEVELQDWIKTPKPFLYQNEHIYLSGKVWKTGLELDSISIPAQVTLRHMLARGRKADTLLITAKSSNPFLQEAPPYSVRIRKHRAARLRPLGYE
jgi:hypothetical protein